MVYAAAFLIVGMGAGNLAGSLVFPPPLPEPGTQVDEFFAARTRAELGKLPLVKELRARRDAWLEYDAYMTLGPDDAARSMTATLLEGSRAIAVQRVFWNKAERRVIAVVFLGGAMAGWPGVLHGGASATILQENLERVAGGPDFGAARDGDYRLSDFTIRYRKPAYANRLYVVRAETEGNAEDGAQGESGVKVKAALEDALDSSVVCEAHGTCLKADGSVREKVNEETSSLWSSVQDVLGLGNGRTTAGL